jgi:hypothetical protein
MPQENETTVAQAPVDVSDSEAAKKAAANKKKREKAKAKKAAEKADEANGGVGRWQKGKLPGARAERRDAGEGRGMGVFALEPVPKGTVIAAAVPALSVVFDPAVDLVCSFCFDTPKADGTTEHEVTMRTSEGSFGVVLDDLPLPGRPEPMTVVTRLTKESANRAALRVGDRLVEVAGQAVTAGQATAVPLLKAALEKGATEVPVRIARPNMIHCMGCKKASVCQKCIGQGCLQWHNYECSVLQTMPGHATAHESATIRMLLRYKMSIEPKVGEWTEAKEPSRMLNSLQANACDVPPDQLDKLAKLTGLPMATAAALIYQVRTNAAEVSRGGKKVGCALSVLMGWHNHDCTPSAVANVTADGAVTVRALRDIAEGEEVTISYVDARKSVDERRKTLALHYGFECKCARCVDENHAELKARAKERNQYLSGLRR